QSGIEPGQWPAFVEQAIDGGIDGALLAYHAIDDFLEERKVGRTALTLVKGIARGARGELRQDFTDIGAGEIHLVKGLHRAETGSGTRNGRLAARRRQDRPRFFLMSRWKRTIARAASA